MLQKVYNPAPETFGESFGLSTTVQSDTWAWIHNLFKVIFYMTPQAILLSNL